MSKKDSDESQNRTSDSDDIAVPKKRKYINKRLLLLLLLLPVLGYAIWKYIPKGDKHDQKNKDIVEETLYAKNPLLQLLEPDETGIDFQNRIDETIENNYATNINVYNGGGVTIGDMNNDNLPDIYFVRSNGQNCLYINQGDFKFKDIAQSAGLSSEEGFETSAAAIDINADGFLDLYVCRAGPFFNETRRNKLYINNGPLPNGGGWSGTFAERSSEYGLDDISASTGSAFFDGDSDGDLDLYLLNYPKDNSYSVKITASSNKNGRPSPDFSPKDIYDSDRYYRNDFNSTKAGSGSKKFTDVSQEVGIWNRAFGLSASVSDVNRDGYLDVYVGNDFMQPDQLFINSGKGTFTDQLSDYMRHCSQATMGSDLSDFDNDGLVDIYTVDMMPANNNRDKSVKWAIVNSLYITAIQNGIFEPVTRNVLQRNNGNGTFSDVACLAGVFRTDWSWSGLVADFDNDMLKDIYVSNGYRRDIHNIDHAEFSKKLKADKSSQEILSQYKTMEEFLLTVPTFKPRDFIYRNTGNWQFEDKGGAWATMKASWSCGASWADLDLDGDLDLVVNNLEDPAFIFKNLTREQNKGNYLQAKLHGSPLNPFAVGASVLIEYPSTQAGQPGQKQYQEISPNRGIFSSSEHLIHFGMGQVEKVEKLSVRWPDGKTQILTNVPTNQRLQLDWKNASGYVASLMPVVTDQTLLSEKTNSSGVDFQHNEYRYNDFENFPLMPWMESELGPLVAKGDVNSDGLDDFFVGNSFLSPAALYVQTPDGKFKPSNQGLWENEKVYEDHGAVFFDFEGDGDHDLFVVSGGVDAPAQGRSRLWQNRLYLNDGKGNFGLFGRPSPGGGRPLSDLPPNGPDLGMRVATHDYDNDGDLDLFIGGRIVPDKWPLTPRSTILRNDAASKGGGRAAANFTDVTETVGGDFARCGMVTDLAWADLDKDGQAELVVVGEWMPVSVFKLKSGKLNNVTAQMGLGKSNGLWFCLKSADLDGDGDLDLVTGNFGLNTRFTANPDAPFGCYAKDFDNNGTLESIVTFFEKGKKHPLVQKEVLVKQLPALKKKFLYASSYANATVEDIWTKKDLETALQLLAYDLETCWWENQGGKFVRHSLPFQAQISAIQGIVAEDLNGDGHLDLLMAGNKFGLEVGSGRYDAGNGVFLSGDGKGNFSWVNNLQSGFWATHNARDLVMVRGARDKRFFVVGNNNSALQVFE